MKREDDFFFSVHLTNALVFNTKLYIYIITILLFLIPPIRFIYILYDNTTVLIIMVCLFMLFESLFILKLIGVYLDYRFNRLTIENNRLVCPTSNHKFKPFKVFFNRDKMMRNFDINHIEKIVIHQNRAVSVVLRDNREHKIYCGDPSKLYEGMIRLKIPLEIIYDD